MGWEISSLENGKKSCDGNCDVLVAFRLQTAPIRLVPRLGSQTNIQVAVALQLHFMSFHFIGSTEGQCQYLNTSLTTWSLDPNRDATLAEEVLFNVSSGAVYYLCCLSRRKHVVELAS